MEPHRWAVGWIAIAGIDRWSIARLGAFALAIGVAYAAWSYESDLIVPTPAVLRVHELPPSRALAPARRVVWIMVDGLRLDASRDMHVLNKLRAESGRPGLGPRAGRFGSDEQPISGGSRVRFGVSACEDGRPPDGPHNGRLRPRPDPDICIVGRRDG